VLTVRACAGHRRPLDVEAAQELRGDVLRVRGGAAIAEDDQLVPRAECLAERRGKFLDVRQQFRACALRHSDVLVDDRGDPIDDVSPSPESIEGAGHLSANRQLTMTSGGAYAPPPARRPRAHQQESSSQMSNVRLISTAALELRMGPPIGAPDAGDLCPS